MGILGSLLSSFGEAIADVRNKVVEEGWFGRQVTDHDSSGFSEISAPEIGPPFESKGDIWDQPRQKFEEAWAPTLFSVDRTAAELGRAAPELDR